MATGQRCGRLISFWGMIAGISDPIKRLADLKQLADRVIDAHACARMFAETRRGLTMSMYARLLGIAAVVSGLGLSETLLAGDVWKGSWKFEMPQDQPWLGYYDTNGKTVFLIGCGTHFEMLAVYPAAPKQDGRQSALITIANGKTQMDFAGFIDAGSENTPPHTTIFDQADLGYPELDEDKWRALENRVLDLLGSGQPLTISAEGQSYVLPPVNVPRWRARFQKIC
ncbi:MAG: hypothetical protein WA322_18230 [Pseudolabrys sp.]